MIRRRIIIVLAILVALTAGLLLYIKYDKSNQHFSVTFLNVGQGDSILIKFGNGEKMLVDCGIDNTVLQRLGKNLSFYDRTIDYLLVTHPDADHYGGCAGVLRRYKIKEIIINGEEKNTDPYWLSWQSGVEAEKAVQKIIKGEESVEIASSKLHFLSPDASLNLGNKSGGNNNSIVFTLEKDREKFIFMGDAEIPLEDALVQKYCVTTTPMICPNLKSDYIKIGHHGSDSSSGELFLEAVQPTKAIISVGKNKFGHPSFRVLKKLQRADAEVLRTDELGDITL